MRRLVLTSVALLMATAGMAALSPSPARAGYALQDGRLTAAVYDRSPFPLKYMGGWSQYGFVQAPVTAAAETGGSLFVIQGSPVTVGGHPCYYFQNTYNAWFTYQVTQPHSGGAVEYITMSIHGTRKHSSNGGCTTAGDLNPAVDVWQTSTPPPSTWRYTAGPPPNVIPNPKFIAQKDRPEPFDLWVEEREGPGVGLPAVVSLGDSTISGEAGRWAGNTNLPYSASDLVDAGADSYWDTPSGESITDCHRSKSALVHIGAGYRTQNFACSAAETFSYNWNYGWPRFMRFKPGVDLYCNGTFGVLDCPGGQMGQLNELYHYARTHNVKHIVLAVGANDFDFSGVTKQCMKFYEEMHAQVNNQYCYNSGVMQEAVSGPKRDAVERAMGQSLSKLVHVMNSAGYTNSAYSVILQNYWSPIPSDDQIRIPDEGFRRQQEGGCPLLNPDASALNEALLPAINGSVLNVAKTFRANVTNPRLKLMDVSQALKGHRLCEKGVGTLEDVMGVTGPTGTSPLAVDKVEWVAQARSATVLGEPYTLAEGAHANYWGQLAERNCLRMLISNGNYPGGKCVPKQGGGVNYLGEPAMSLTSLAW